MQVRFGLAGRRSREPLSLHIERFRHAVMHKVTSSQMHASYFMRAETDTRHVAVLKTSNVSHAEISGVSTFLSVSFPAVIIDAC